MGTFGLLTFKVILVPFGAVICDFSITTISKKKKKRHYFFYKSQPKFITFFSIITSIVLRKELLGLFFEILRFRFLTLFFSKNSNSRLYPMEKSKTSVILKTIDRRAKRSEIWDSRVVVQHIWGTFGLLALKVIWGHSVHFQIFVIWA